MLFSRERRRAETEIKTTGYTMVLEAFRFPLAASYLKLLPDGFESYPECRIKADVLKQVRIDFPELKKIDGLPDNIGDVFWGRYRETWLSEVAANTLQLIVRESCFDTDTEFLSWQRRYMERVFDKPLYRAMMHVFSTSLIVMGASKRWSTFHTGSTLRTEKVKKLQGKYHATGILTYPPHLFGGLLLHQLSATYLAALDANRAEDPEVTAEEKSPTETLFHACWKA